MPAGEAKLKTTPIDPRFPNQNQAQHCWYRTNRRPSVHCVARRTRYNEYVLCLKNNDGDEDSCKKYFQAAHSICPSSWFDRWEEERENGTFAGVQFAK
ncbi:hypothetical protein Poli38472_005004 [Pythium oligandrum]|uniref:Cytochrome c oxidase subunit VIb n=1 Tax=Pythium oligandrum TaxID=41045 RepID=A0A8K1CB89_PYTOL|nr:hypothetical protein Poli38472_005004 [Pythium oligandrum]|eukprot:TMW59935.1 hypothetical protein Poli38472_005004 [Pythium oligandrum]